MNGMSAHRHASSTTLGQTGELKTYRTPLRERKQSMTVRNAADRGLQNIARVWSLLKVRFFLEIIVNHRQAELMYFS